MNIRFANFDIFRNNAGKNPVSEIPPETDVSRARRRMIQSIELRLNERRTSSEKLADNLTRWFGDVRFLWLNAVFFIFWVIWNAGFIPPLTPFDPYPFNFLTMLVSLEAIFLSIFVLMSQNRESRVSKLREEIDIQVNLAAEQEITKIMRLLSYLMKHLNVPIEKDPELKRMLKPLNTDEIQEELERQLGLPPQK